jgi:mono/diheme cytochrome c family protein
MRARITVSFAASAALAVACWANWACWGPKQPPPGADAELIYELQNCANCHGERGSGARLGPPLGGIEEHWSAPSLAEFLADPESWRARDARLAEQARALGSVMEPYANLSAQERLRLAEWLLALPATGE